MAIPAARTLVAIEDSSGSELTVKVTGYQWKWQYEYVDQGVSFFSTLARKHDSARQLHSGVDPRTIDNYLLEVDNPLVVPQGVKVRVLITAADVIHAWWVPDFGMKKDAIPGFINELWFTADKPGTYRGQCAELCGRDHGFMPVVVEVRPRAEFDTWLAAQKNVTVDVTNPVAGITAPNTMISACTVVIVLKKPGSTSCMPGMNSSARITSAIPPPVRNMIRLNTRYIVPMSLWLVVVSQRRMPFWGPWWCSSCPCAWPAWARVLVVALIVGYSVVLRAASQASNSARGLTSTTTGMKPWSRPQSSAHCPR